MKTQFHRLLNHLGEQNPQLFREIKGKFKPRNLAIAGGLSVVAQMLIYGFFLSKLPLPSHSALGNPYCTGSPEEYWQEYRCVLDRTGQHWLIHWERWWLDIFLTLSVVAIAVALVGGVYVLMQDFFKEESRGTLGFIRLSPQSFRTIFWGKLLGVPSLIYGGLVLAMPLHGFAASQSHIPLFPVLLFYGLLGATAVCFYHGAVLLSLVSGGLNGIQVWLGTVVVALYSLTMFFFGLDDGFASNSALDWGNLFFPGILFPHLVAASPVSLGSWELRELEEVLWFGWPVFGSVWSTAAMALLNVGLWSYGIGQVLKRRFYDDQCPPLGKTQSYGMTLLFAIAVGGFFSQYERYSYYDEALVVLFLMAIAFFCVLILGLTPQRQAVQDWARYHHHRQSSLLGDLLSQSQSPALVALAINGLIFFGVLGTITFFDRDQFLGYYPLMLACGFSNLLMCLLYGAIAQWMLLKKNQRRWAHTLGTLVALIFLPILTLGILNIHPDDGPGLWLFSALGVAAVEAVTPSLLAWAIAGQTLGIILCVGAMAHHTKKLGRSLTNTLLSNQE